MTQPDEQPEEAFIPDFDLETQCRLETSKMLFNTSALTCQESQAPPPRRRWSRRTANTDSVMTVKSMLDLRLLDSYGPDGWEEMEEVRLMAPRSRQTS